MVNRYSGMLTEIPPGYCLSFHRNFPSHHLACLETDLPLDIEHDLQYNVIPVGQPELIASEKAVKSTMVLAGSARESELKGAVPNAIFILNFEKVQMDPLNKWSDRGVARVTMIILIHIDHQKLKIVLVLCWKCSLSHPNALTFCISAPWPVRTTNFASVKA